MNKQLRKIKWQDWAALGLFGAVLLILPMTNAIVAGVTNEGLRALTNAIDVGFTQLSLLGMEVMHILVTLLVVYIVWRTHTLTKIKIPKKSAGKVKYTETN